MSPVIHSAPQKNLTRYAVWAVAAALAIVSANTCLAQDRGRDGDRVARLDPGTSIPVRVTEAIDVRKGDNRVYTGIVDADVRGNNGRIVAPRGATVELMVRYSADNDMRLDLESIDVNGQRYAIRTDPKHIDSRHDNNLVGSIVGAINGEPSGRAVRIGRDTVITFRLAQPLEVGVEDRGVTRDGHHYHDWYGNGR